MHTRYAMVAVLLVLLSGCFDWAANVRSAAAVEHSCAKDRIIVVSDDGNQMARTVQLDVCGQRRVYRDVGGQRAVVWVDVTSTSRGESPVAPSTTHQAQPAPTVALTSPADFPSFVRSRIDASGARVLACIGADSGALEATWTETGTVTLMLREATDAALAECVSAAVGSIDVPAGAASGRLIHPVTR